MATLSATLLARLRRKIDDEGTPPAFSDDELNDIYDEADGNWNLTLALCFEELRNSAAKFSDYKQNESEEKRKQIFDNLFKLASYHRGLATSTGNQVRVVGLKSRPPRNKTKPRGM